MDVIRDAADDLIRDLVKGLNSRETLERAIREAISLGATIDAVSEASGYTPAEIRRLAAEPQQSDWTLDALAGNR